MIQGHPYPQVLVPARVSVRAANVMTQAELVKAPKEKAAMATKKERKR